MLQAATPISEQELRELLDELIRSGELELEYDPNGTQRYAPTAPPEDPE